MSSPIRRALLSVSDKSGLAELGRFLVDRGVALLSTGGSARALASAGLPVTEVADYTGFPEILDGRVKTLQPRIHGGLLAIRNNAEHQAALQQHGILPIDLLVVNLYPFEATVAGGAPFEDCVENIDIGGPALIRAAAKNHAFVTVLVDPADYPRLIKAMTDNDNQTTPDLRRHLAAKAYARTAAYDTAIAAWFAGLADDPFPQQLTIAATCQLRLRYGENPHQNAALYVTTPPRPGIASAQQVQGKELSYNNLADSDAAYELIAEFDRPAVAIIKHANPCGVAVADSLSTAWHKALACDPVSAFGGIVAVNRPLDGPTADAMAKLFLEVIIAPALAEEAQSVLASKKNLRVLITPPRPETARPGMTFRSLAGGLLMQQRDTGGSGTPRIVSLRAPSNEERNDLEFAFTVAKHVKSNAIVFVKGGATVGIGAGQMSRVDSARIAVWKAEEARQAAGETTSRTAGSVVASDAFFPFPDGLLVCADAGATAAIQPGGSVRDEEVIAAANQRGMAMLFTGMRHFRH